MRYFIKAKVLVSSSFFLSPLSFINLGKLKCFILHLSARAPPKVVLPEALGPIKKKV